jgi:hypothetical protein
MSLSKILGVLILRIFQDEIFEMSCQFILELHRLAEVESFRVIVVPE